MKSRERVFSSFSLRQKKNFSRMSDSPINRLSLDAYKERKKASLLLQQQQQLEEVAEESPISNANIVPSTSESHDSDASSEYSESASDSENESMQENSETDQVGAETDEEEGEISSEPAPALKPCFRPEVLTADGSFDDMQVALDAAFSSFESALNELESSQSLLSLPVPPVQLVSLPAGMMGEDSSSDGNTSDNDSDTENHKVIANKNGPKNRGKKAEVNENDSEDEANESVPRTKNEVESIPISPPSVMKIPEKNNFFHIGEITCVVDAMVVVKSLPIGGNLLALDAGSILAFQDRHVLGEVSLIMFFIYQID